MLKTHRCKREFLQTCFDEQNIILEQLFDRTDI